LVGFAVLELSEALSSSFVRLDMLLG